MKGRKGALLANSPRLGGTPGSPGLELGPLLSLGQGLYFLVAGAWPLVSIRTFVAVTGPKSDVWLVKTAGVRVAVIGAVLGLAGLRRRVTTEVRLLAMSSSTGLAAIDVVYVLRRRVHLRGALPAVVCSEVRRACPQAVSIGFSGAFGERHQGSTGARQQHLQIPGQVPCRAPIGGGTGRLLGPMPGSAGRGCRRTPNEGGSA